MPTTIPHHRSFLMLAGSFAVGQVEFLLRPFTGTGLMCPALIQLPFSKISVGMQAFPRVPSGHGTALQGRVGRNIPISSSKPFMVFVYARLPGLRQSPWNVRFAEAKPFAALTGPSQDFGVVFWGSAPPPLPDSAEKTEGCPIPARWRSGQ